MKVKVLKTLALLMAAVLLVVATVFATMAYLTSSSAVSNVFTVGEVTIEMFETKVNSDGERMEPVGTKTADANSYLLKPSKSYLKDPTVYVKEKSVPSYLFVRVRNDLKAIEKQGDPEHPTIRDQLKANGWALVEENVINGVVVDAVFVYVGKPGVGGDPGEQVMHDVEIDGEMQSIPKAKIVGGSNTVEEYDVFQSFTLATEVPGLSAYGGARVAIVAYAIQTDIEGFELGEKGTYGAYNAAWEYIKEELPFVV